MVSDQCHHFYHYDANVDPIIPKNQCNQPPTTFLNYLSLIASTHMIMQCRSFPSLFSSDSNMPNNVIRSFASLPSHENNMSNNIIVIIIELFNSYFFWNINQLSYCKSRVHSSSIQLVGASLPLLLCSRQMYAILNTLLVSRRFIVATYISATKTIVNNCARRSNTVEYYPLPLSASMLTDTLSIPSSNRTIIYD